MTTHAELLRDAEARAQRLRATINPIPQSATGFVGTAAPPPPAVCTPVHRPVGGGLPLEVIEQAAASVRAERARALAIMAEAEALGIAREQVDAALAAGIGEEEFVRRYAPAEALAREIIASASA